MKRILLLTSIVLATINLARAQNTAQYYRQFFFNPFLFNPAFVAINKQAEVNFVYRQQWAGFKDAPSTTGVNFQYATNGRVALGFSVNSDKQVLLRNSTFSSTFGYEIPLNTGQSLRFGLSAGVGLNTLDLTSTEMNSNDPVIANSRSNYYPIGNFGLLYSYSNLRIGFAFNDIFRSSSFESKAFNGFSFSSLKNRIYSLRYKFKVGMMQNIAIEPYLLYHQSVDKTQNAWEAASILYLREQVWAGAGYNQARGLAFFLGANIKEKLSVSYSYELPSRIGTTSSHEIHLNLKFRKKKAKPVGKFVKQTVHPDESEVEEKENNINSDVTPQNESSANNDGSESQESSVVQSENNEEEKERTTTMPKSEDSALGKPTPSVTFTKGHYVVVGAFKNFENSKGYKREMAKKGYSITVSYNAARSIYYAYIYSSFNGDDAREIRNEWRRQIFRKAWVFSVE